MADRLKKIKEIRDQLFSLKVINIDDYAKKCLIDFYVASEKISSYIYWLLFVAPKLDAEKLKEINDLDHPEWEEVMYKKLIQVERSEFIALVKPLVQAIYKKIAEQDNTLILLSLGSGSMEVEKQVLNKIIFSKPKFKPCIFIGIDISSTSKKIAKENLSELEGKINIIEVDSLDFIYLQKIKSTITKHTIILATKNIFDLEKDFPNKFIDLIYSCLFRHHLDKNQRDKLNHLYLNFANSVLEYDGFKSWFNIIPQTIIGWNEPVFLNSEIFSNLRFQKKKLVKNILPKSTVKYFANGYYLLKYHNECDK